MAWLCIPYYCRAYCDLIAYTQPILAILLLALQALYLSEGQLVQPMDALHLTTLIPLQQVLQAPAACRCLPSWL